jgi:hypothetical protein
MVTMFSWDHGSVNESFAHSDLKAQESVFEWGCAIGHKNNSWNSVHEIPHTPQ